MTRQILFAILLVLLALLVARFADPSGAVIAAYGPKDRVMETGKDVRPSTTTDKR